MVDEQEKIKKRTALFTIKEFKNDACKEAVSIFREAKSHTSSILTSISNRNKVTINPHTHQSKAESEVMDEKSESDGCQRLFIRKLDRSLTDPTSTTSSTEITRIST